MSIMEQMSPYILRMEANLSSQIQRIPSPLNYICALENLQQSSASVQGQNQPQEKKSMEQHLNHILDISESQLTCSICSDLIQNPATVACGHTFCLGCIQDWFQTKENCPCCRESCIGGETSSPVAPMENFLKIIKPLVIHRDKEQFKHVRKSLTRIRSCDPVQQRDEEDENANFGRCSGNTMNAATKRQKMEAWEKAIKDNILGVNTVVEQKSLEVALTLVKCALAKENLDEDEFAQDMERFQTNPQEILDKYMDDPTLTDVDYQYVPKMRKTRITLHWPTLLSWAQMGFLVVVGGLSYWLLKELEEEGFHILTEPLLRAIGLMNMYLELFAYFN